MRRMDKNISDIAEFEEILNKGDILHLALADAGEPYVIPMNYGYRDNYIYIHCADAGRKLDMIRKNSRVCFNVAVDTKLFTGVVSCAWTYHYRSVTGYGQADITTDRDEVIKGLDVIMAHYGKTDNSYTEKALEKVALIKIKIEELTGKRSPAVKAV